MRLRLAGAVALWAGCSTSHPPIDPRLLSTELRAFTSEDGGETWALFPDVMAHGIDSLGLSVREDGALWVTGHDHATEPPPWERWLGPKVRGLQFDGSRWARKDWRPRGRCPRLHRSPVVWGRALVHLPQRQQRWRPG